jgi:hypothetical protein
MSLRDNIKGHFKAKVSGELRKMTIDEWSTDIHYKSAYSFAVESKIINLQQQGKTVEALVESILLKALDPDGKPLFQNSDRNMLMYEADPTVLLRVATELNSATSEYEEIAKN